ncbi:MAG: cobalamin biosynthesis protein CobD, partial [Campylobacterales bacterium]|nr:cobalamin biosynthesis protein CobD [Campylobacterales bacterium]
GEFRFIKHPVIIMGELITFFENHFYKDSIFRGLLLVVFVLFSVGLSAFFVERVLSFLPYTLEVLASSIIASMFIAHKMLYDSVKDVLYSEDKKHAISMLVSRDTEAMSGSDINKAAIETYAENLSDGVVAPIFYLLFFGLFGIIVYKAINTMDSMVGYKNERCERFGKVAARLDDIANFIPSRITAVIIMLLAKRKDIFAFYKDGSKHESPNAGHPITAMAIVVGVKLGGDTSYFGKIKKKPFFGDGREEIMDEDVLKAINFGKITL